MKQYKHLFFDLDGTLWDFETSAWQAFVEMYSWFGLQKLGIPSVEDFMKTFKNINDLLWGFYRKGEILKEVLSVRRFEMALEHYGIRNALLAVELGEFYLKTSPNKVNLFPNTHEILAYLKPKYILYIITNGFEEVQHTKIHTGNLGQYFAKVITSERAGVKKPDRAIFDYALRFAGAMPSDSVMIGDDLNVDIAGACAVGMDTVFANYNKLPYDARVTYEVDSLIRLKDFL